MAKSKTDFSSWHVSVAAEALASGQLARIGYDISVQYGANQPEYDLLISKGKNDSPLKISVKGSKDGSWGLTQKFVEKGKADYINSIDKWCQLHGKRTILCFVQFKDLMLDELPRIYLATPKEVADHLKKAAKGRGDTILYENHTWKLKTAAGYGTTEKIPENWKFSVQRVDGLYKQQ
ncbi:MAG: hypothetical protein SH857_10645 [Chitinophagales bacterium]|nr:hypothetical protein [Chitinophagales bacterium]